MKYPRADALGDSWQALAVESAQTELKIAARDAVLTDEPFTKAQETFGRIIRELTDELESETLILRCKQTLPTFALRVYMGLLRIFGIGTPNNLAALSALQQAGGELGKQAVQAAATMPRLHAREWAYNRVTPNFVQYEKVQRRILHGLREIVSMEPKPDYETNVNLRNVAEMEMRLTHQLDMIASLKDRGVRLVWIEPHANCSKRCEKYQGKLYSLDGTRGVMDGEPFLPLKEATDNPRDFHTTKAGITYHNGCITGFNCRHRLIPYQKGNKPDEIPANVIRRQRYLEGQQREMEREIRRARETTKLLAGIGAGKAYKKALARQVALRKRYEAFSEKHHIPFYRERLRVMEGEQLRSTAEIPKNILALVPPEALGALQKNKNTLQRY